VLGDRVRQGMTVTVDGHPLNDDGQKVYILLNKPRGIVCTSDPREPMNVVDYLDYPVRIFPVGRLDKDSEGLLIMTDDGEFANKVSHPSGGIKKTYLVMLAGKVENNQLDMLRAMRMLDDEPINPVEVNLVDRSDTASKVRFVLSEGKNRQIRRMCEAVGLSVMQLRRVQMGCVSLGKLESGTYRHLTDEEKAGLLKGLNEDKAHGRTHIRAISGKAGANRKRTGKR
jgi:23S rRNA pseudouridine2605 synthase